MQADRAHRLEISDAEDDLSGVADEGLTWRVSKAAEARHFAARGAQDTKGDSVLAPNGIELDKDELDAPESCMTQSTFRGGGGEITTKKRFS